MTLKLVRECDLLCDLCISGDSEDEPSCSSSLVLYMLIRIGSDDVVTARGDAGASGGHWCETNDAGVKQAIPTELKVVAEIPASSTSR